MGRLSLLGMGSVDVSFHSPAWHAARVAALQTERISWEDWKLKQKEEEARASAQANEEERLMREYRAQLDADRAKRLAKGTNNSHLRDNLKDKKASKKRKRKDGREVKIAAWGLQKRQTQKGKEQKAQKVQAATQLS